MKKRIIQILILILILILLIRIISLTISKYESSAISDSAIQVALYVLNRDYQSMSLNLESLFPRDEPYVYYFSVSNSNGDKTCETDMEYDLTIRTTTNLPIEYELYKNEQYTNDAAQSIIKSDDIVQDDDNTYFRVITTETETFSYNEAKKNIYQLVVRFPAKYNTINYQDIIEAIEITVDSKQII